MDCIFYSILYDIFYHIPFCTVLYCNMYYTIYCTLLYCSLLYYTVLCTVLCSVLYYTILFCNIHYCTLYCTVYSTIMYWTVLCILLCALYCVIIFAQYSTIQYTYKILCKGLLLLFLNFLKHLLLLSLFLMCTLQVYNSMYRSPPLLSHCPQAPSFSVWIQGGYSVNTGCIQCIYYNVL